MNNPKSINLLPIEFRRKVCLRDRLRQWTIVTGVVAAFGAFFLTLEYRELKHLKTETKYLESKLLPLRSMQRETAEKRGRLEELTGQQSILNDLEATHNSLRLIGIVSQAAAQEEGWVQVRDFLLSESIEEQTTENGADVPVANVSARPPVVVSRLRLNGMAADDMSIARFISDLRDVGVFTRVELKSSADSAFSKRESREFHVECTL